MTHTEWKKEMNDILDKYKFEIEKIPSAVRRCPKCNNLTLVFDAKKGKIKCTSCGFEEQFKML